MPFAIPNDGDAQNGAQSAWFNEDIDIIMAGINGVDCVLAGCAPTAQGSPDMTVAIAKGAVLTNGVLKAIAAANATITTADGTYPRIDYVVINSSGSIAVRAGTPAAAPKPPTRTANDVVLAAVWVPAADTTIATAQIVDKRVMMTTGPITIYKTVAAETTNTTSAVIEALNKANSGVTIPSGLFLSGKTLRVRMGGTILANSTTPTIRVIVLYGGTTMYSMISGATTNDADRLAWFLTFDVVALSNTSQAMHGLWAASILGSKTAPTTGTGQAWSTADNVAPIAGTAAVDSDAANRLLSVQIQFSVSNAADELVVNTATVELV